MIELAPAVRTVVSAVADAPTAPVKILVTGGIGTGKSTLVAAVRAALRTAGVDVGASSAHGVVVIDDAHLLGDDELRALTDRVLDPASTVVVATEPREHRPALRALMTAIERERPRVILAAWSRAEVARRADIHDVIDGGKCAVKLNILDEQTAMWMRDKAQDLMTNWLTTGQSFDGVISNNDEMAIGAILSMKAAGMDMSQVVVGGVDATQDALAAMAAGDLDVTVFQDAAGQGAGALDAALKLAKGEAVDQKVYVPFQLVTPDTLSNFTSKN